jgi:predicted glycosyltransferase
VCRCDSQTGGAPYRSWEVFISPENDLPPDLERYQLGIAPEDIHYLLAFADRYVGDSGTTSSEAVMLGTPAIRATTMAGPADENVFRALEDRYGLLQSYSEEARAIRAVEDLLACGIDSVDWQERRDRLLEEQPDVTAQIVATILESTTTRDQLVSAQ